MANIDGPAAWNHLNRTEDGTPIPAHAPGDRVAGFELTAVDPFRQTYLVLTNRCAICAHKLHDGLGVVAICQAIHLSAEWHQRLKMLDIGGGLVQVMKRKAELPSRLWIPMDEGESHPECLRIGAQVCPFLHGPEHVYKRDLPEIPAGYGLRLSELEPRLAPEDFARIHDEAAQAESRIGKPSGRKWMTPPR